jgi:hypothetical protein
MVKHRSGTRWPDDTVCGLHHAQGDKEHGFLGLASKLRSTVSWFGFQNRQLRFGGLGLKITTMVFRFGLQNWQL